MPTSHINSPHNLRVLVTGVGGPAGGSLARQLLASGVHVLGTDMTEVRIPGVDTIVIPPASDPRMIDAVRDLVSLHSIDVVLPTVSEELPELAAKREAIGPRADVVISAPGPVLQADDKFRTSIQLASEGVAVPMFGVPSDFDCYRHARSILGETIVAKPRVSRGGRGVVVVRNEHDIDWSALRDDVILQAFAPGDEYAPVIYRDPDAVTASTVVVLKKTGLANGEVGNATGVAAVEARDIADLALAAAEALDLTGPVDIDIRRQADRTPVVLEINARFGANSAAAPGLLTAVLDGVARRQAQLVGGSVR